MSPATRLLVCRFGFLAGCLLPTALVAGWALQRSRPEQQAAQLDEWRHALAQRLGLEVAIGRVFYPGWRLARLEQVELRDPESGAWLASARVVDVFPSAGAWIVEASQPELAADQLPQLLAAWHDRVFRGMREADLPIEFVAQEITLRRAADAQTLSEFHCAAQLAEGGPQATLRWRLPGSSAVHPAQATVIRHRGQSPAATRWELDTGDGALPCSLLAGLAPTLASLGERASFHGSAWFVANGSTWQGEAQGRVQEIDLDALVTEQFAHKLSGQAELALVKATFADGQLVAATGTVQTRGGHVSRSLIDAAAEHLGMRPGELPPANSERDVLPYRRLAAGFHLDEAGLRLQGVPDLDQQGVILASAAGPLLLEPADPVVPALALVRTLVPQSELQVPATRQTSALLAALPVPQLQPPHSAKRSPRTPVRLQR